VARYCASQLPWFTGAFFGWFCKLLEAISNLKLAYIVKIRHGEAGNLAGPPTPLNLWVHALA
jgi:hypothetical protein